MREMAVEEKVKKYGKYTTLGIDIGSRQGKAVLLCKDKVYSALEPTGFSMQQTADRLKNRLLEEAGIEEKEIAYLVGTGYGRVSMHFENIPNEMLTEISCHGMGASCLGEGVRTVLDIGGQDSKIIKIDPVTGRVIDFAMNDKCAAGTGRFLERAAELLGYEVTQIGEISLSAKETHTISSQCVVFAESEIVSARAAGVDAKNILAGVHASVTGRVKGLFKKIGMEQGVIFTGGVSNNAGMVKALEDMLGFPVVKPKMNPVYAGALGAAVYARKKCSAEKQERERAAQKEKRIDLSSLTNAVEEAKREYIAHEGPKKNVAYLCAYTPLEILEAAGVRHIRLLHTGNEQEIAAGEAVVSKIACDYTKSFVGGFAEGLPLYQAVDKVYSFYTCSFMTAAVRSIQAMYKPAGLYAVPRLLEDGRSPEYYVSELENFVKDLEVLTGKRITRYEIKENIRKYNEARKLLREISGYRKETYPLLSGTEYQQIALSYYYLPADRLLKELKNIKGQLENLAKANRKHTAAPLRIMITGGILTEEDKKVVAMLEKDFKVSVVVEDNCSGYMPFAMEISEEGDELLSIAQGYLGKAPCANLKPLDKKVEKTVALAQEYHVDGVVYYFMQFCPTYGMAKKSVMTALGDVRIPSIDIAGNYTAGDEGQIKTRLEAFLEVLKKRGEEVA